MNLRNRHPKSSASIDNNHSMTRSRLKNSVKFSIRHNQHELNARLIHLTVFFFLFVFFFLVLSARINHDQQTEQRNKYEVNLMIYTVVYLNKILQADIL